MVGIGRRFRFSTTIELMKSAKMNDLLLDFL